MIQGASSKEAERTVQVAARFRLAALFMERPRSDWSKEVSLLAREVREPRLLSASRSASEATEGEYNRLFGAGGVASPREVSYCGFEDPGRLMSELTAFYGAFAYRPRREDPIDHIAVEIGFVSYLLLKEAYALVNGHHDHREVAKEARRRFLREHLARLVHGVRERCREMPPYLTKSFDWLLEEVGPPPHPVAPSPIFEGLPGCSEENIERSLEEIL